MTFGELISKASMNQRKEMNERVIKLIGTEEEAKKMAHDLEERIRFASAWRRNYEKLAKIFLEHGDKALAMTIIQEGCEFHGITASGKNWVLYLNNGITVRSRYCGTLNIDGETIFTSGKLDKVFEYIMNN